MEANIWNLLLAPEGTPQPVMDRLAAAPREVTEDAGIRQKLARLGVKPSGQGGEPVLQIEAFVQAETDRWGAVIKAAGVSAD